MRCPRCQSDGIPEGAKFCTECGTPLVARAPERRAAAATPGTAAPQAPAGPPPPPRTPQRPEVWAQRTSPLVFIEDNELPHSNRGTALLVALAIAFVGAGVWLAMSSQSSSAHWSPAPTPALSPVAQGGAGRAQSGSSQRGFDSSQSLLPPVTSSVPASAPGSLASAPRSDRSKSLLPPVTRSPPAAAPARSQPAPVPSDSPPFLGVEPPAENGLLSVSTWPWGNLSVDGRPAGDTPVLDLPVSPGPHRLRIERDGFQPVERTITIAPGQRLKLTGIALEERSR